MGNDIKKYRVLCGGLIFVSTLALLPLASAAEPEAIGVNAAVKGDVTITGADAIADKALVRQPVFLRDRVDTARSSSLQILLRDETTFTIGAQCQMEIDEFVYDPKSPEKNALSFSVEKGIFRFMSGKTSRNAPENISFSTPTASLGIRGTMFEAIVGPEALLCAEKEGVINRDYNVDYTGATLIVLRGPGPNSNTNENLGKVEVTSGGVTVTLTESGSATFIGNKDAPPSKIFYISDALYGFFNRNLRTAPRGELNYSPFDIDMRLLVPEYEIENEEGLIPYDPAGELDIPGGDPIPD